MSESELKKIIIGVLSEHNKKNSKQIEFSKKLIIGTIIFIGVICIVSILSWLIVGDWSREIAEFFIWPFIVAVTGYMGKSAYENKAKIQDGKDGK